MNTLVNQYNFSLIPYFLLFSLYVRIFFFILHNYLNIFNKKYITYPIHRRQYITKNIVKSVNLGALTLFSIPCIIYPAYFYNYWNNNIMKICGLFYSSNDFIALVCVKKLSPTTKNHHRVTIFLSLVSLGIDYTNSTLGRMLFVYTLASSSAFIVNYYLGIRFLYDKKELIETKKLSRNVYGISLLLNWGWHIYWSTNYYYLLGPEHIIYFFMLFWIIKDDIILFKWLCN